jgi:NAD(P)-dependent dehydrogenase (short-subunit alcohol dehydrogenase family)
MSERVAIVAGAGGELGRATAEKLAAAGFTVVGVDPAVNAQGYFVGPVENNRWRTICTGSPTAPTRRPS